LADSVILWGAGCALGGLLTLFSEIGTPVYAGGDGFPLLYLGAAAVSFLWTRVRRRAAENRTVRVRIEAAGRKEELTGLCDTGSFAADPIGGIPAIHVKRKAVPILAALAESAAAGKAESGIRVRMIPVRGLGGERLLTGFVPDRTFVGDAEVRAAVAVDGEGESYGGAEALVPARLIP
ncbi:MAG: sigma-E processing peptidase SpoIIGA, partial [Clostridia bacterium]|nr:sigma-E processing peptidase SpoIIGA [Clostridia bacterium]